MRPFQSTLPLLQRIRLKKIATSTAQVSMLSSVTNAPFSARCQEILHARAKEKCYTSRYWLTQAQARRTCNATVLPGEKPTVIYLAVEEVVPFAALPRKVQKRVLEEHPPFFGSGVGILTKNLKWNSVTAERLVQKLNPKREERALFVDVAIASELDFSVNRSDVVDIRKQSSVMMYNVEQLDDPYKGEPQRGLALNATTGKRLGQPAHDILLAVGIMRGYSSPMWVAEPQLKFLNVELLEKHKGEGVVAPNMVGMIVSLSVLPVAAQNELLADLKGRPDAFGYDVYFLYSVNGWEPMRSRSLVKNMAAVNDQKYPFHFVNLRDLGLQKPQYAQFARRLYMQFQPIGLQALGLPIAVKYGNEHAPQNGLAGGDGVDAVSQGSVPLTKAGPRKRGKGTASRGATVADAVDDLDDEVLLEEMEEDLLFEGEEGEENTVVGRSRKASAPQPVITSESSLPAKARQKIASCRGIAHFFAEDVTQRCYYNACCTNKPHLTTPAVRSIAILNGKLIGKRDEALLRAFALKHRLSSPIWLTEATASRLGVGITEGNKKNFVQIGAGAAAEGTSAAEEVDEFYNIDDFEDKDHILAVWPKNSSKAHYMLDSKWRPVLGKNRQAFLSSLNRPRPMWVSVGECLMSGFTPKAGAPRMRFPSAKGKKESTACGEKLYNSQFTTDPVRVIGLATCYVRPQGHSL